MIKGKQLKRGSKIAIISPSAGLPNLFPEIYELGLRNIEAVLGCEIVEMPTARMAGNQLYRNPMLRAKDINDAFLDPSIDGIICSIGGYESVRILEYLDVERILKNPKMIMGFSDATTFLSYLNSKGLITFYGPSVMAGWAQLGCLEENFKKHVQDFLLNLVVPYPYTAYSNWTQNYKDWSDTKTLGQCGEFYPNANVFDFLQGNEESEGFLWGGCVEVLELLKGTKFWPECGFWEDKILFFETSEDKPLPFQVGNMIRNYGIQGILNQVKGILIARPKDYSEEEKAELKEIIKNILEIEFGVDYIPVVMNVDFGHTDPKFILPLGCLVKILPKTKEILLLESPWQEE